MSATATAHDGTVLGGIKGSLAALGGCAALDTAYAPWRLAFVDGAPSLWMPFGRVGNGPDT
ncbi:MAG: hypothetical protein H0W53_06165 [Acidobacteria bacterium]|nr:hypothetical protein [Acidobacteriota bacterium]